MKAVTAKHLKRLEGATWFANVGKPLKDHVLLATWDQAIEHADGDHWMEEIQGMVNHFGAIITSARNNITYHLPRHIARMEPESRFAHDPENEPASAETAASASEVRSNSSITPAR